MAQRSIALAYADKHLAKVISCSLGFGQDSQALFDAVSAIRDADRILVFAAGNQGSSIDGPPSTTVNKFPAQYNLDNMLTVASVDQFGNLLPGSNYSSTAVHVGAPGLTIRMPDGTWLETYFHATSGATPFVAGVASLVWSENPTMSAQQVVQRIKDSTTPCAT